MPSVSVYITIDDNIKIYSLQLNQRTEYKKSGPNKFDPQRIPY